MKKIPFVKQLDLYDCGAASLSMIIQYYDGFIPIEKIRDLTHTTKNGVSAYHLIEASKKIGLDAIGYKVDNLSNIKLPCIAHVIINKSYYHYIVIYEINYEKEYLLIADPADRIKKISFVEFKKIFNNIIITFNKYKKLPLYNQYKLKDFFLRTFKQYRTSFIKIVIMSLIITLLSSIVSFYTERMINNTNNSLLFTTFYIFLFIFIFKNILDFIKNRILIKTHMNINKALTNEIFNSIILLPYRYFKNRTSCEVLTRFNDIHIINETIIKIIITVVLDLSLMIFSGILLLLINYKIFILSLSTLVLYVVILKIFNNKLNKKLYKLKEKQEENNSFILESINSFETIKGLGIEKSIINEYKIKNNTFIDNKYKFEKLYNLEILFNNVISEIGICLLVFIGYLLVLKKELVVGNIITCSSLFTLFIFPIKNILELNKEIKDSKISYERIKELLFKDINSNKYYNLPFKNIKINNLNFSYDNVNNNLKNINLNINSNEKIMIVGKSGSGKSTILKLLKKYYPIDNNQIIIDNFDINKLSKEEVDKNIIYISQNEFLFTDTLYNNLTLYRNIQDKKIFKIIKDTNIDFIDKNLKLNMVLEENGFNLSGGQRKRIVLARSLLSNFRILLLDEVFSEMDIDLERKILKSIFKKYHDKIIIVVSHRKDNLDLFSRIIEFENGKIINDIQKHLK